MRKTAYKFLFTKIWNGIATYTVYFFVLSNNVIKTIFLPSIYYRIKATNSGKVRVYNNSDSSREKIILGNADEYIEFRAAFKDNAVHIFVDENYVGSFVKSRNSLTANVSEMKVIRIRSMSDHTDQGVYIDNMFVCFAYEN